MLACEENFQAVEDQQLLYSEGGGELILDTGGVSHSAPSLCDNSQERNI